MAKFINQSSSNTYVFVCAYVRLTQWNGYCGYIQADFIQHTHTQPTDCVADIYRDGRGYRLSLSWKRNGKESEQISEVYQNWWPAYSSTNKIVSSYTRKRNALLVNIKFSDDIFLLLWDFFGEYKNVWIDVQFCFFCCGKIVGNKISIKIQFDRTEHKKQN